MAHMGRWWLISGCTCSVNTKWPAQWQAQEVCLFGGFYLVRRGVVDEVRESPDPEVFPKYFWVYLTFLKNAQAPGLLSFQFRGLWFIPWSPNYNTQGLLCCKKHLSLFKFAGRGCVQHANQPDDVLLQYNNPEAVPRWEVLKFRVFNWAWCQIR